MMLLLMACAAGRTEECLDTADVDFISEYATLVCDVAFFCYGPDPFPPLDLESCYYLEVVLKEDNDFDPCLAPACLDELSSMLSCDGESDYSNVDFPACDAAFGTHEVTGE